MATENGKNRKQKTVNLYYGYESYRIANTMKSGVRNSPSILGKLVQSLLVERVPAVLVLAIFRLVPFPGL